VHQHSYQARRGQLETYFDRTAVQAWARLTSDAPLGRIRSTVRAGRDQMRNTLLGWLPQDLRGARILDAGCGTGMLSVELARRGADVVAVDLSPKLVTLGNERIAGKFPGTIDFRVGDMSDPALGRFDHIVCMDSLIHYRAQDTVAVLANFAQRARRSIAFTFAPKTPALALMHAVGSLFPRGDRAPAIEPVGELKLEGLIAREAGLATWMPARMHRVTSGFYISQAMQLQPQ
jgi:magnesium-protoporphyrin O-methyltransferase